MTPKCNRSVVARGLCKKCYYYAREILKRDNLTWTHLCNMGLCRSVVVKNPFVKAYEEAKANMFPFVEAYEEAKNAKKRT
jgi:hypothetical protein